MCEKPGWEGLLLEGLGEPWLASEWTLSVYPVILSQAAVTLLILSPLSATGQSPLLSGFYGVHPCTLITVPRL